MEQGIREAALIAASDFAARCRELVKHKQILGQHQFDLKRIGVQVEAAVASELNPATNKPAFPNETMRKAEVFNRLQVNQEHKRMQDLVGHEEDTIAEISAEIEILKMTMRAYEIAASYDMIESV